MERSFEDVLDSARAGEAWAVAVLWRELNPQLLRFLRGRDPRAAVDVASETWIRVGRAVTRFEGSRDAFRSLFFTIARRALIDWQRRESRRSTVELSDSLLDVLVGVDDTAGSALENLDTDAALNLVATLPADQADAVLLRVVGGLSVERVAEIMTKSPGNVRVLQHRALRRLAELLSAEAPRVDRVTP